MAITSRRSVQRRLQKAGAFCMLLSLLAAFFAVQASSASAIVVGADTINGFEVDGNEVLNSGSFDWKHLSSNAVLTTLTDESSPDIGLQGSSKEEAPLSWTCQSHDPYVTPGKDNLLRAYISTDITPTGATLGLGFVRADGGGVKNGDTHINFELDKGPITFNPIGNGACPYSGRQTGDLLLAFDFPGNGSADVTGYSWNAALSTWDEFVIPGNIVHAVAATDNSAPITAANDLAGLAIPTRAFGEAGIDLVKLDQLAGGGLLGCPGFAHVSIRSRASGSAFDSALQDIMSGSADVSTCGSIKIHKVDDTGAPLGGATFGLYPTATDAQNHTNVITTCTSLADGTCTFAHVTPSDTGYYVSEISSPAGYNPDPFVAGPIPVGFRESVDFTTHTFTDPRLPSISILKTADAATVSAGSPIGFTITVSNSASAGPASGVTIDDDLPAVPSGGAWTISPAAAGCAITNGHLHCDVGTLATGASFAVHVTHTTTQADCKAYPNTAYADATNDHVGPVSSFATTTVSCPDLRITKTADAVSVPAGDPIGFTVTVSNPGAGTATGVALNDPLPSGVAWTVSAQTPANRGCAIAAGVLTCPAADLAPGGSFSVHVSAATSDQTCAAYNNTATADGSNTDPVQASASTTVLCPGLGITKTADASSVSAGDPIGFTIVVSNTGAGTAADVGLDDPLPAGVTWTIASQTPADRGCTIDSGTLSCPAGDLVSGGSFSVHVTAPTTASDCTAYPNTATADGSNTDPVQASATTTVLCPSLGITKTADAATVSAGDPIGFTVTVSNGGPGVAKAVTLSDPLPVGVTWTLESQTPGGRGCSIGAGTLSCPAADLGSGQSFSVHVTAPTTQADCHSYLNTASASASNNATVNASATTTVLCPNLGITKIADAGTVSAGDPIGFTITVTNGGPGVAKAVTLNDPLPAGVDWALDAQTPPTRSCAVSTGTLSCPAADLASGASFSAHVTAPTTQDDCATYDNTATADGSNTEPVEASASTRVLCPDLGITKTADAASVASGSPIGFTITVANAAGTEGHPMGTAKDVVLNDPLPGNVSWSIAAPVPPGCSITAGALVCAARDIAPGESLVVHVTGPTTATDCGTLVNTATADGSNTDPVAATARTEVICPLAIGLVKGGPDTAGRGETVTYTFAATNIGNTDLVTVVLSDAKCDDGTIKQVSNGDGDTVMAVGETWSYTCTRVIRADDPNPLPNTATVVGTDARNRTTTATASHTITIIEAQVLGEEVVRELPRTGSDVGPMVTVSLLLLAMGVALIGMADENNRRRLGFATGERNDSHRRR